MLHGPSTLTISLPSDWVKRFNIEKGKELNLEEHGRNLIISTESTNFEQKQIDIENLERVGKSYITSSYRQGYDEIEFTYKNNKYLETIQNLISREITGFEVIRSQNNRCVIMDLTGHNRDEFETALRRTWLLILDLSNESFDIIKKEEDIDLKNIRLIDCSINKFSNYCLRILIKKGRYDHKKTPPYYHFVKCLEEIADKYKDLCIFHSNNLKKTSSNVLDLFVKTNSHLNSVYESFYKYDPQKIEKLFEETKATQNELAKFNHKIAIYLSSITRDIRNLLPLLIEVNI